MTKKKNMDKITIPFYFSNYLEVYKCSPDKHTKMEQFPDLFFFQKQKHLCTTSFTLTNISLRTGFKL